MTEKHLIVCWTRRTSAATRFEQLSIPWQSLVEEQDFLDALAVQVAKELRRRWEMEPQEYPLF